jgi:hypothetical protein
VCPRADLEADTAAAMAEHLQLATAKTKALEASFETKTAIFERELHDLRKLVVRKVGDGAADGPVATPLIKRETVASPATTALSLPHRGGHPTPPPPPVPSELDSLRTGVERLSKTVETMQTAHDALDVNWAVDPAALTLGADVHSGCFKPRHDVKLHLMIYVRADGFGVFFHLDESSRLPLHLSGWSLKVCRSARDGSMRTIRPSLLLDLTDISNRCAQVGTRLWTFKPSDQLNAEGSAFGWSKFWPSLSAALQEASVVDNKLHVEAKIRIQRSEPSVSVQTR